MFFSKGLGEALGVSPPEQVSTIAAALTESACLEVTESDPPEQAEVPIDDLETEVPINDLEAEVPLQDTIINVSNKNKFLYNILRDMP